MHEYRCAEYEHEQGKALPLPTAFRWVYPNRKQQLEATSEQAHRCFTPFGASVGLVPVGASDCAG